ncbi:hypothetical protein M378DRAFT_87149 [Amanita muscaria Koide BX008]|uniref:Cytochrome P450 monooxygenase pc-3 n=1 Tax=Amanita muscaria (strain Koide BX008) TaxID=946122 RepID=A0A0C2WMN2_AMAMK|nr:hypothetical protein M378DRAFT_87149 [Amanita muscaria Koide BX008]
MSSIPPGFLWLFQQIPSIVSPLLATYLFRRSIDFYLGVSLPLWATMLTGILSFPLLLALQIRWNDYKNKREAERLGAVLAPVLKTDSYLPFGLGILKQNLRDFAKNEYFGELFFKRSEQYGWTWNVRTLSEDRIFTTEPEHIKAILATQFDSHAKGPASIHQMTSLLGVGVFNSDGMYAFHRAMTRPFFTKDRITHFDIYDRHAQDAFTQLKSRLAEGFPVDIQDLASRFTMDSATEFLFGQDVHSLGAGLPYPGIHYYKPTLEHVKVAEEQKRHPANIFTRAFDEAQFLSAIRARWGVYWPLKEFWKDEVKEAMVPVNGFITPIVEEAVKKKKAIGEDVTAKANGDRETKEGETLLDHLINYSNDQNVLRDETLNILLAGRDTTANSITYAIYMLAEHPQALERLRNEILGVVGPSERPTYEDVKDMKYLRAVINETLRLFPAVPSNGRASTKATVWPSKSGGRPYYIPANTKTPYSVFVMHRRKDLWGPDADNFDPDRFLDQRQKEYLVPNPFIFLPFNAGPRICLGQQFAYNEISFFLIRLLQQFSSITLVSEAQPPESRPPKEWASYPGRKGVEKVRIKNYITMSVLGGLWVKLEEAKYDNI